MTRTTFSPFAATSFVPTPDPRTPPRAVRSVVVVERGFVVAYGTLAEVRAALNGGGAP